MKTPQNKLSRFLVAGLFGAEFAAALICACTGSILIYSTLSVGGVITLALVGAK